MTEWVVKGCANVRKRYTTRQRDNRQKTRDKDSHIALVRKLERPRDGDEDGQSHEDGTALDGVLYISSRTEDTCLDMRK